VWSKLKEGAARFLSRRLNPPPEPDTRDRAVHDAPPVPECIRRNVELRGIHGNKRGFIVCNGPSINKQDLRHLKGELIFSVSSGYHHPHYLEFAPRYHCIPQIAAPKLSRADRVAWLREMHENIGSAEVFLSLTEAELVETEGLFPGRAVRYLNLVESFDGVSDNGVIDIAGNVPGVQSVPIMCLMIAMYMGISPIYLLGVEHDHFRTGRYEYFYQSHRLKGVDPNVSADGLVTNALYDEFASLYRLWSQYRKLRQIAEANAVQIFNATEGGALDEFPRVRYEDVVTSQSQAERS
jgi:hypothetical protein